MPPCLLIGGHLRPIESTLVMGVVNASPESFSDAGQYATLDDRLELVASLIESGADIVDIGGQSAITNQPEIDADVEAERVVPIVEWVRANFPDVLVSVDTYKPRVVDAVLAGGAHIINDVSGLLYPEIASSCAAAGAALVVMHTAARPKVRLQEVDLYADVTEDVVGFLSARMEIAMQAGLPRESLIIDPGPDFTKTAFQTVEMLRHVDRFRALERPLLLALSRKDFLGAITGRTPRQRGAATAAAIAHFATEPGNIVRVHDVAAAVDVIATIDTLVGRRDLDPGYLLPDSLRYEPKGE